jgi:hypothetical protein
MAPTIQPVDLGETRTLAHPGFLQKWESIQ